MWQTPYWLALAIWGGLVILASLALMVVVILVPGGPDSGYTGRVFLIVAAGWGLTHGVVQIQRAKKEKRNPDGE